MATREYSTAHRVADIPEILELILSYLDDYTVKNSLTVCKRWANMALNNLWREVDDPRQLFSLLAPGPDFDPTLLVGQRKQIWAFGRTPDVDDWQRFTEYARRVRCFSLVERSFNVRISTEVFDEMSRSRVSLNILPNLRTLIWLTDSVERMRYSRLFQHDGITHFSVSLFQTETYPLATFFKEVLLRMPNLTCLDLKFNIPVREFEGDLIELVEGLPKLRLIIMPVYSLTSRIVQALSGLKDLDTIQFEFVDTQGHGDIEDVLFWSPQLQEGAFPSLADLSLSVNLPDLARFLCANFAPTNLTSLYVHILSAPPLEAVNEFLTALSENCQALSHLYMDFFTSQSILPTPANWPRLNWETLRPLLSCPKLVSFEIRWDHPLEITLAEIEEIASKWPELEVLLLNCEPLDNSAPPMLGLEALVPFARHCPKLQELGLYLSTSSIAQLPSTPSPPSFRSLRRLNVGLSPIDDPGPAALFLSQLCPPECEVLSGVTWPDEFAVVETPENALTLDRLSAAAAGWFGNWTEVSKMLPLLVTVRAQERLARETLTREAEDLRIRCRLMEERAGLKVDPDAGCTPF